nr:hypothetical protein [Tanacetum cinerariifolium]
MKGPLCVEKKVMFAPPNYSKENYLATFAQQIHLTPEHIFWSLDVQGLTLKPILAMMVYPPNTLARLIPRVLPIKSQVKIILYTLTQLFTKFDKTCKKRITPYGLTEGERGFEQTKECYLTESSQDAPEFDSFFEINQLKEELQGRGNTITELKEKISHLNKTRGEANLILDSKALYSRNKELTEHVTALQEQNARFRAENEKIKQHYKELYDSIKIMRAKTIEKPLLC